MNKLSEVYREKPVFMLCYGAYGVGKTDWLIGAGDRQIVVDLGKGLKTLIGHIDPFVLPVTFNVGKYDTKAFDRIKTDLFEAMVEEKDNYDTVSIDELTTLGFLAKLKGLGVNADIGKSGSLDISKKQKTIYMELSDWGQAISEVDFFLAEMTELCFQLDKNFILLAHQREIYKKAKRMGELPEIDQIRIGIYGRTFPDAVPNHFDYVWYFTVDGKEKNRRYTAQTKSDSIIAAKTRGGSYENIIARTRGREGSISFQDVVDYNHSLSEV